MCLRTEAVFCLLSFYAFCLDHVYAYKVGYSAPGMDEVVYTYFGEWGGGNS